MLCAPEGVTIPPNLSEFGNVGLHLMGDRKVDSTSHHRGEMWDFILNCECPQPKTFLGYPDTTTTAIVKALDSLNAFSFWREKDLSPWCSSKLSSRQCNAQDTLRAQLRKQWEGAEITLEFVPSPPWRHEGEIARLNHFFLINHSVLIKPNHSSRAPDTAGKLLPACWWWCLRKRNQATFYWGYQRFPPITDLFLPPPQIPHTCQH